MEGTKRRSDILDLSHAASSVASVGGAGSARGLSFAGVALAVELVGETESAWCTGGEVACGML